MTANAVMIAAGVAAAMTGHDQGLGAIAVAIGGLGSNGVAADIYKTCESRLGSAEEILRNHDLSEAVGKAIAAVILHEAQPLQKGSERKALYRMADSAPKRWCSLTARQDPALAGLAEVNIPALFSQRVESLAGIQTLEPDTWRSLLGWLDDTHQVSPAVLARLSECLHQGFAEALRGIMKSDCAANGKAFPALALMLMGETHAIVREVQQEGRQQHSEVMETLGRIEGRPSPPSLTDLPVSGRNEIPLRNRRFTGRDTLLETLHAKLSRGAPVALTGIPGVGKTETATEYLYRYRPDQSGVHWINADTRDDLDSSCVDIARRLRITLPENAPPEYVLAAVKQRLAAEDGWLLVFNNVDDLALVSAYFPGAGQGQILITTRPETTGTVADALPVAEMGDDEGALLLLRRAQWIAKEQTLDDAGAVRRREAEALSRTLGGLPLALDQAGAYMEPKRKTPAQYLTLYEKCSADLLAERGGNALGHKEPVTVTFSLAFGQVEKANAAAADLLRVCAFLAADAIPEEIFVKGASVLGEPLSATAPDERLWDKVLGVAERYALLRRNAGTQSLSIHRLVQTVLKHAMHEEEQRQWAERTVLALDLAFPEVEFENWSDCERLLPQALECAKLIDQHQILLPEAARLLNQTAYYSYAQGKYDQAAPLYIRALAIMEAALGAEHPSVATGLNNLAELYRAQGKNDEAAPLYIRALAIKEVALGAEHPSVATGLNNLAGLYGAQGKYDQAAPLYVRALAIMEAALGTNHPNVAVSLENYAFVLRQIGRVAEALPLEVRARNIWQRRASQNREA